MFQFKTYCVNATESRTFIYTYNTQSRQNYRIEDIQRSNIYFANDQLTSNIENAFAEMCYVKLKKYQKHIV